MTGILSLPDFQRGIREEVAFWIRDKGNAAFGIEHGIQLRVHLCVFKQC